MEGRRYEFVIVGSGAGGATLARELSKRGKEVLVVERGRHEAKVGTVRDALRFYDATKLGTLKRSKEGVALVRTIMAGGSTVASCGCAVRCLEEELAALGIALDEELAEAEREMGVAPIAEGLLSEGSERLRWAAQELGYTMELMPKSIDPVRCEKCGQCVWGCITGAKWTALDYLDEAQ
jgi:choline dehydrogenase-like flavoprotein